MGRAVVHFEVIGKDAAALQSFYSGLFDWQIDADNPMNYGIVTKDGNTTPDGGGIRGGPVQGGPELGMFADPEGHAVGVVKSR